MDWGNRAIRIAILLLLVLSSAGLRASYTSAQEPVETPLIRQTEIVIPVTEYEWWVLRWINNQIVCQLKVAHEGVPTAAEVFDLCGEVVYDEWIATPPCELPEQGEADVSGCSGMYFYLVGSSNAERTVTIDLPLPTVWLSLAGCSPVPPENICGEIPSLLFTGEEPLPNEQITAINIIIEGVLFRCEAEACEVPPQSTLSRGAQVEFWAESSFGDESEHFTALVRVQDTGATSIPDGQGWHVDVISSQWRGQQLESCAQIWKAFPPVGGSPFWLSTPSEEVLLASDEPYHYLAGRLINHGLVDASACPAGGLLENGYANACGLESARPMVDLWQNQFDSPILQVAQETGLPAQLMKNLFAQESQFWPGVFRVVREFGLGQLTDMGADTILLWNEDFFNQFCPLVLDAEVCGGGYLSLQEEERAILRGALAVEANADCPECSTGIDLTAASYSVNLFAQSLIANCRQVHRTIFNATESIPGEVSTYENLWRFTLANYHAGPGCLAFAIHEVWADNDPLDWEHVSAQLTEPCQGVISYVDLIAH